MGAAHFVAVLSTHTYTRDFGERPSRSDMYETDEFVVWAAIGLTFYSCAHVCFKIDSFSRTENDTSLQSKI